MTENPNNLMHLIEEATSRRLRLHFVQRVDNQGEPCGCGYEDQFVLVTLYMSLDSSGPGPVIDVCVPCAIEHIKSDVNTVLLIELPRGLGIVDTQSESYQLGVGAANAIIDADGQHAERALPDIERVQSAGDFVAGMAHTLREYVEAKGE